MATRKGFEPSTKGLGSLCSVQLSYRATSSIISYGTCLGTQDFIVISIMIHCDFDQAIAGLSTIDTSYDRNELKSI